MKTTTKNSFNEIMRQLYEQSKITKLLKKSEATYLMRSFKIYNISAEKAIKCYQRLSSKYSSGQLKTESDRWYKNERKLFIEYLICYSEQKRVAIHEISDEEWRFMGELFWNKNPLFLKFQGLCILKNTKHHNWTPDQDSLLKKLVTQFGSNEWNSISKSIFTASPSCFISPKQCRERWLNHISSAINKAQWTTTEDIKILKCTLETGKKWAAIATMLQTHRTEHMVKNRYNSIISKKRKRRTESEVEIVKKALEELEKEEEPTELNEEKSRSVKLEGQGKTEGGMKEEASLSHHSVQPRDSLQKYSSSDGCCPMNHHFRAHSLGSISFSCSDCQPNPPSSLTPCSTSPLPGLSSQFYRSSDSYISVDKKREDGTSLFSPACFSPGLGFSNFGPGYDLFSEGRHRGGGRRITHWNSDNQNVNSDLCKEYAQLVNSKKEIGD